MKLKMLAAVCALVATSAFAQSSTQPIVNFTQTFANNSVVLGNHTDHFTFTNIIPGDYSVEISGATTGKVSFKSATLNNSLLTVQAGDDTFGPKYFDFTLPQTLGSSLTLDIAYKASHVGTGNYSGNVFITPSVPEPETYALMLAGLGAMFFIGRRRAPQ